MCLFHSESEMPENFDIAIVEDDELKWRDIVSLLSTLGYEHEFRRAKTLVEANKLLDASVPCLLVLDISMNISGPANVASRGTHANIGGLEVVERMYLLDITCPTIVFTGFDLFKSGSAAREGTMDLGSLSEKLKKYLGENLIATIRYGSENWREEMSSAIKRAAASHTK